MRVKGDVEEMGGRGTGEGWRRDGRGKGRRVGCSGGQMDVMSAERLHCTSTSLRLQSNNHKFARLKYYYV
jgi:hypothetical protein